MRSLAAAFLASSILAPPLAIGAPTTVTITGSLQSEVGCPGDYQPDCVQSQLVYDAVEDVWQGSLGLPAGAFGYFAAIDGTFDEVWGANASPTTAEIPLVLAEPTVVKLYYDDHTHWLADSWNGAIAVVAGSFQSELGCPGDWDPSCLVSWLQDPDGDGLYRFAAALPGGEYEFKIAHDESWTESYGEGGLPSGANIPLSVAPPGDVVEFRYDLVTHAIGYTVPEPGRPTLLLIGALVLLARAAVSTA